MSTLNIFVTTETTESLFEARRSWTRAQLREFKGLLRALNNQILDTHLHSGNTTCILHCHFGTASLRCLLISYENDITAIISRVYFDGNEFDPDDGFDSTAYDNRQTLTIYRIRLKGKVGEIDILIGNPEFSPRITKTYHIHWPLDTQLSDAEIDIYCSTGQIDKTALNLPPVENDRRERTLARMDFTATLLLHKSLFNEALARAGLNLQLHQRAEIECSLYAVGSTGIDARENSNNRLIAMSRACASPATSDCVSSVKPGAGASAGIATVILRDRHKLNRSTLRIRHGIKGNDAALQQDEIP